MAESGSGRRRVRVATGRQPGGPLPLRGELSPPGRAVLAARLAGASYAEAAKAGNMTPSEARSLARSTAFLAALRQAYAAAGVTPERIAALLDEALDAVKNVSIPSGPGKFTNKETPDWRVRLDAMRLFVGMHQMLAAREKPEEPDQDKEIPEVVTREERANLSSAELFDLYRQRLREKRA